MNDPISYTSTSPRYGLPLLFAGQAQKEFYVNEAHAIADALLHPAIEGEADSPPTPPQEGECWLVGSAPTSDWADHAGDLACYQAGTWIFVTPRDGMRLLDQQDGQDIRYRNGSWQRPPAPTEPSGGTTVDSEARTAIVELVDALISAGILPES